MGWIILTILFGIVGWLGLGYYFVARAKNKALASAGPQTDRYGTARDPDQLPTWPGLAAAIGTFAVWLLVTGFFMVHTVGQRQVAIVYDFANTIKGKRDPGVVTIAPWEHIRTENVGIQHNEWVFGPDNSAVSQDQQRIFGRLAVNYQIDSANVVDLYKRVGASWKDIIIDARVPQVFKEVTSGFQTADITQKRPELRIQTRERLADELKPYDIKVVDVFITNLGFSDSYTESIEAKQKQVQDALRQEAKVREAKAIADQEVAKADGEKRANIARAQGDATANRLRRRSLTPLLVQWEAIQKLNPKAQLIICPPGAVCVPNTFVPTGGGNGAP